MTKFQRWMLRKITERIVVQSPSHYGNIHDYYQIMNDAVKAEFTEDNIPTRNGFLTEIHERTLDKLTNEQ